MRNKYIRPLLLIGTMIGFGSSLYFMRKNAKEGDKTTMHKETIKQYIPTIIASIGTMALIGYSYYINYVDIKQLTALFGTVAGYTTVLNKKLKEVDKDELINVHREIAEKNEKNKKFLNADNYDPSRFHGEYISFFDEFTETWFSASLAQILGAINEVNKSLIKNGKVSVSDFYELLHFDLPNIYKNIGWSLDNGVNYIDIVYIESKDKGYTILIFEEIPERI